MQVVFTKPWVPKRQRMTATLPLSLLYLASYLQRHFPAATAQIVDPDIGEADEQLFLAEIVRHAPQIVGISIFSHLVPAARRLATQLKQQLPHVILVGGGPHINAIREQAFVQLPEWDYFIAGEGELGMTELVRQLQTKKPSWERIPGLLYTQAGQIHANANDYCQDLNLLDPLDYRLVRVPDYFLGSPMGLFHKGENIAQIITTRGCPYPCTFCASPVNTGKKVRTRPIANIMQDLEILRAAGADEIHIMDDNFTFHKSHVLNFCHEVVARGFRLHFALPNGVRLDRLDDEVLAALKQAGFYHMGFGIEVGSDQALKRIKKNLTYALIREKLQQVKRFGIGTSGFFIIGFPFETEADILETLHAPDRLGLALASFGNFTPLPGTELYNQLVAAGEIPSDYLPSFASGKITYSPKAIPPDRLERLHRRMVLHYYFNLKRLWFIARRLQFKDLKFVFRRLYQIIFRPPTAG